jgi:hypothetical protein
MTDQERTNQDKVPGEPSQNDLADELRELGIHIKDFLHAIWESQERKQVQQEIKTGLSGLGASLSQAATDFQQSPSGQKVKEEFETISERIRSGEMEAAVRRDFMSALRTANAELSKALNNMAAAEKTGKGEAEGGAKTEPKP